MFHQLQYGFKLVQTFNVLINFTDLCGCKMVHFFDRKIVFCLVNGQVLLGLLYAQINSIIDK